MTQPLIISVILNTNRRQDTLACLASLTQNTYKNQRALVLDNQSTDGSVEAIRARFPETQIVPLTENRGYTGNNNVGIQMALEQHADWIFVLNEDTILGAQCLAELIRVGESDPHIGMVGPLVYHGNEPDVIQSAGGIFRGGWEAEHLGKNERDAGQFAAPQNVDWLTGCSILARREAIEQVGMLDERMFIYYEETEWCLRAKRAGWRLVNVPQAKLWHKGVKRDYKPTTAFTYYKTRNRFFMLAKHHAPLSTWLVACVQTMRTLTSWTLKPKWRVMREHRDAMWQGTIDFLRGRMGARAV
jgi:GT2 family glycosyltransferase